MSKPAFEIRLGSWGFEGKRWSKLSKLVKYCWGEDDAVFLPAIIYFLLLPIICNIRLQGDLLLCRRSFVIAPILEPTFQERYSQVARSGKHSEYTVIRFIFFGLKLSNVGCQRAGVAQKRANFEQNKILKDETSHGIFRMFPRPCDLRVFLLKCRL